MMRNTDWTPKEVAEQLEEAARTLRRLPPVTVRGFFSSWPPVIRDFWEAFGWNAPEVRPGPPSAEAIDRMDAALRWLLCLEADEVRLVWLRAEGVRWKSIAHRFGIDRSTAWRHWTCGLIKIAAHLNASDATKPSQQKTVRQRQSDLHLVLCLSAALPDGTNITSWLTRKLQARVVTCCDLQARTEERREQRTFSPPRNPLRSLVPSGNTAYAGGRSPEVRQRQPGILGSHRSQKPPSGGFFHLNANS